MNKKKILWQAHEGNVSGANIALLEYIDALSDEFRFHVVLPHGGNMEQELQKRNISISIVPQYSWATTSISSQLLKILRRNIRNRIAVNKIKQIIRNEKFSLVFTNTQLPYVAAKAANQLKIPHIWWIHEFGEEDFGFSIGFGQTEKAYKKMQNWSKLVICNSEAILSKFKRLLPNATVKRIYQPVTFQRDLNKNQVKHGEFLMFGQIIPSKGHEEVVHAIAEAKRLGQINFLSIVGPSENQDYLECLTRLIKKLELTDQIKIQTGFFQKDVIIPFYRTLIVASKSEAFGRVIIEANKAGLHVLVKKAGGAPEIMNESNGLLYENQEDLIQVFLGNRVMPSEVIFMTYEEKEEIKRCKDLIFSLL